MTVPHAGAEFSVLDTLPPSTKHSIQWDTI